MLNVHVIWICGTQILITNFGASLDKKTGCNVGLHDMIVCRFLLLQHFWDVFITSKQFNAVAYFRLSASMSCDRMFVHRWEETAIPETPTSCSACMHHTPKSIFRNPSVPTFGFKKHGPSINLPPNFQFCLVPQECENAELPHAQRHWPTMRLH